MASTAPPNAPPQPQPQQQPAPGQLPPGAIRLAPGQRPPPGAQRIPMPPPGAPRPMMPPQTDPALLEALDATFEPQPIAFHAQEPYMVLCPEHKLEKCAACDVDYAHLNRLSRLLAKNPNLRCPPPPQVMSRELQAAVTGLKEEGNKLFKAGQHQQAVSKYTMAASVAVQRPPWEASQFMREDVSAILSNRAASFLEVQDPISALADANAVVEIRRPWSKGHFRRAKALQQLGSLSEAAAAARQGLAFEPASVELKSLLDEIERAEAQQRESVPQITPNGEA
ncbi:hypothetical protein EV122DRAFT_257179 [Schizophyllum commune]